MKLLCNLLLLIPGSVEKVTFQPSLVYSKMLKLGTPFLSCFPEECVLMSIYGQSKFRKKWKHHKIPNVLEYAKPGIEDTPERIEETRNKGVFFLQLQH